MANFEGTTACNPARVSDPKAVKEYIDQYSLGELEYEIEKDGQLHIYGYDWFDPHIYIKGEDGEQEIDYDGAGLEDFCEGLKQYIAEGQKLEVACVGNEKCRYVSAMKVTITQDAVKFDSLGT